MLVGNKAYLNSITVTRNVVVVISPPPVLAQNIVLYVRVRTCGHAVDRVIRTHDGSNLGVAGALLKRRHVVLGEVLGRHDGVEAVSNNTLPSLHVIAGIVFARCYDLADLLVALKTGKQSLDVTLDPERVLAGCLREKIVSIYIHGSPY